MMSDYGVGALGGVVLIDPATGLPYKAEGGGGGAVDSVNGQTGVVVLGAGDVGAATAAQGALASTAVQPAALASALADKQDAPTSGTPSATTYLRGDGSWATPPNTTYTTMSQAEAENPASTTARTVTGQRISQAVTAFFSAIPGYDAGETQTLKNVSGVLTWVTD